VRSHKGKVTVFVPHYAMSGGTLIALAADEIVMCQHSMLGPVDPQLGHYPAASILDAVERKPVAEVDDNTLILADQARKALAQMDQEVKELLAGRFPDDKAAELARLLSSGVWTHDYAITFQRAQQLGLPVCDEMPSAVFHLMKLYPQPIRRQPAVEYVPRQYPRKGWRRD
jgi:ClpP class serine protease